MPRTHVITADEAEKVLQTTLSAAARRKWQEARLEYRDLSPAERDRYLVNVIESLVGETVPAAGAHRQSDWEKGWRQNLEAFKASGAIEALTPAYHSKHKLVRWRQQVVRPTAPDFDYRIHCLLVDWAIETFLDEASAIYEFGCGPGYHLLRARSNHTAARLVGLDWASASQQILSEIVAQGLAHNVEGRRFDFYAPDYSLEFPATAGVLTIAALEQVGENFEPFLQFLLKKEPAICVHLEPIDELLDPDHLLDRLSVLYCRKRNYLKGFLPRLRELERQRKLVIHKAQRTYSGSYFIEGHSLVVWAPRVGQARRRKI